MSNHAEAFEHWIRTSFVQMNTELAVRPWDLRFAVDRRDLATRHHDLARLRPTGSAT